MIDQRKQVVISALVIDARYTVDIDNLADWSRYENMVYSAALPGRA